MPTTVANALPIRRFVAGSMAIAVGHVDAHILSKSATRFTFALERSTMDQIINVAFWCVYLWGRDHVACFRCHNQRKITCMSKVAADLLNTVTINVFMEIARLWIEFVTSFELDLLRPLKSLNHTILHVELADVDQDLDALGEEVAKDVGSVEVAVG